MAAGRNPKSTADRMAKVVGAIRNGSTRKAACAWGGISEDTFQRWMKKVPAGTPAEWHDFAERVNTAEAECEVEYALAVKKAATGYIGKRHTKTTKTVFKRKTTIEPDGTRIEEMVPYTETTEHFTEEDICDWRAAIEWLKRRNKADWSEKVISEVTGPEGGALMIDSVARDTAAKELAEWRREQAAALPAMLAEPTE